jgi:mRNA-degrading endonuclease RelE of RelBE toxin-antitoxin system
MDAVQVRFIMHTMMSVCVAAITQVSEIIAAEQQSVSTQNKILTNDEKIRDKRSKKRKAAVEQSTGMYVTEGAESADTAEVPGVQYRINVTDQRSIHEIFEKNRIPKDIRKRIWRFFHDINSDSRIFRYKQLDGVNYNGRPLIALDVDDYRIIVYEVGSVKGQRSFNVLMVGHRREVYEKANRVYK